MRYPIGEAFNLAQLNQPLPSTIIQEQIMEGVHIYSLGKGTSMAPEAFNFYKMLFVKQGKMRITIKDERGTPHIQELTKHDGIVTPTGRVIVLEAIEDCVCLEVMLGQNVNHTIREIGTVFSTAEMGEYKRDEMTLVNVISSGFVDVMIISFDRDAYVFKMKLQENIMIYVYEGEGVAEIEGKKQILKPNDSMRVMKGTRIKISPASEQLRIGVTNFYI